MGKKKRQKTKELSVAIAEASSTGGETEQQQIQPQAPRKRGRPRKIVVETESEEKKTQPIEQLPAAAQGTESSTKKSKGSEDEQHGRQEEGTSSACIRITKEEAASKEMQLPKGEPSRSRARRKSKPRKSS